MKAIIFTSFLILSLVPLLAQNPDPSIRDTALYKQLAEYMPLLLEDSGLGTNSVATFGQIYVGMPGGGASFVVNYNAESEFTGTINVDSIAFNGDPATTRANMELGWSALTNSNAATCLLGYSTNGGINALVTPNYLRFTNTVETAGLFIGSYIDWEEGVDGLPASTSRTNLGLGATWLTNNNVTNFRTAIGLGTSNAATFARANIGTTDGTLLWFGLPAQLSVQGTGGRHAIIANAPAGGGAAMVGTSSSGGAAGKFYQDTTYTSPALWVSRQTSSTNSATLGVGSSSTGSTNAKAVSVSHGTNEVFFVRHDGAVSSLYQRFGSGSPDGVVTAPVGAVYHRTDGGAGTSFYVKQSGTGNTGWVAK